MFLADLGPRPDGASLDRIDNAGNYEPGNCRWSTWVEQANNKRNNIHLTIGGETKTLPQWARQYGKPIRMVRKRIYAGWTPEEALTRGPSQGQRKRIWRGCESSQTAESVNQITTTA